MAFCLEEGGILGLFSRLAPRICLGASAHPGLIHRDWDGSDLDFSVLASDFVTQYSSEQLQSGGETWRVGSKEIMGSECVLDKSICGSLWREGNSKTRNSSRLADAADPGEKSGVLICICQSGQEPGHHLGML